MKFIKIIFAAIFISPLNADRESILIDHVKKSIERAYVHHSKLSEDILRLDGMSSPKVRHFLNNICSLPKASYLEIGVFRGSTFVSALYQNTDTLAGAIAIDNWGEFGNNKNIFLNNRK